MNPRIRRMYYRRGWGSPASDYERLMALFAQQLGISELFFAAGSQDRNAATEGAWPKGPNYGAVNVGLRPEDQRDGGGFLGDPRARSGLFHGGPSGARRRPGVNARRRGA